MVLTILIALGGIVVATLPQLLNRTNVATAAANVPAIDSVIKQNLLLRHGQVGNRFDSLISGTAGLDGEVVSYVGNSALLEAISLTEEDVIALGKIGIVELIPAQSNTENATFDSHDALPVLLASGSRVCSLTESASVEVLKRVWNYEPAEGARYLVLGIGEQCSLVGADPNAAFAEAPVHFGDGESAMADTFYSRYLIVIELQNVGRPDAKARFVGTGIPSPDGIRGVSEHLEKFYSQ